MLEVGEGAGSGDGRLPGRNMTASLGTRVAAPAARLVPPSPNHTVQFYESEAFLSAAATDYLAEGFTAGQKVLVLARPQHRASLARRLKIKGIGVDKAVARGQCAWLDAAEMLATFMVGPSPDAERFKASVGGLIERLSAPGGQAVRAYGEMVDVLWQEGNTEGAIRIEELWNEMVAAHDVTLLCAYAMGNFVRVANAGRFSQVSQQHGQVLPTEGYTGLEDDARLREISVLQQQARALATEVAHREELERRLRDSLTERNRLLEQEQAARIEAESANRAKSEFLAVMSHELRTSLNAIGYVQLVEMGVHGPVTEAQRDALARAQRSQRHLLSLINDVLNLVRIETGHVEFVLEDVSLPPLLAEVRSMIEPLLAANQLSCEITTEGAGEGEEGGMPMRTPGAFSPIRRSCSRSCSTFSATRSSSPHRAAASRSRSDRVLIRQPCACACETRASGFRRRSWRQSSPHSSSSACGRRPDKRGSAWAWRSAVTWRAEWAAT